MLGDGINHSEAAVVVEGRANVETLAAAEVPGYADAGFVANNDRSANGANWGGVKVEGAIEVFPG